MARQENRARLKAEVAADGTLTIPEHKGEWHKDPFRSLWVEATDLSLYQTVSVHEGVATRTPRIVGNGTIQKDTLELAGWGDRCKSLPVTIKPALPQEDGNGYKPFTATLGFIPGNWEFRSDDVWFLECYVPQQDMDLMLAAYRAGELPSFHLKTKLDLWIAKGEEHTPPGYGVTWFMVPATRRESEFPDAAHGDVVVLSWGDARRPKANPDDWTPDPTPAPPVPLPVEPPAVAEAASLAAAVERLRATVLKVGIAVTVALIVGWFV